MVKTLYFMDSIACQQIPPFGRQGLSARILPLRPAISVLAGCDGATAIEAALSPRPAGWRYHGDRTAGDDARYGLNGQLHRPPQREENLVVIMSVAATATVAADLAIDVQQLLPGVR